MENFLPRFQRWLPGSTVNDYRKGLQYAPYILLFLAVFSTYMVGGITLFGGFLIVTSVVSFFYKRSPFYLIIAVYLFWSRLFVFFEFDKIRSISPFFSILGAVYFFLAFIHFQYLEQQEIQDPFRSKKKIAGVKHSQKVESLLAFSLGIGTLILASVYFIFSRNLIPNNLETINPLGTLPRYFLTYTTVFGLSFGLAGWIGNYPKKVFSIIGCLACLLLMLFDIILYIYKI